MPEKSVGFEFKCIVEGNPTPKVTWARGIRNDNIRLLFELLFYWNIRIHTIQDIFCICNPHVADSSPLPKEVSDFGGGTLVFTPVLKVSSTMYLI